MEITELDLLLDKPIWQMSGREFLKLTQYAGGGNQTASVGKQLCCGVRQLADYLSCCEATIYAYKNKGILDDAIVSRIGKRIVFDGEKARTIMTRYQTEQRTTCQIEDKRCG